MSKRAGDFVTLREVIDEVGRDAIRFIMLTRSSDALHDFDLAKVCGALQDNPVARTRIHSPLLRGGGNRDSLWIEDLGGLRPARNALG